jgi:hypothetical protein
MALRLAIVLLCIVDGILHLALNWVLFQGNWFGTLPFPSPFPLPLNQLFTLNFVGYIVLALAFWFAPRFIGRAAWLLDIVIIVYAILAIVGWLQIGSPNPQGLGYISKVVEVALILTAAYHALKLLQPSRATSSRR